MTSSILLARQAIYDTQLRIHGYELLFRSHATDTANFTDGDQATSVVLLNAFTALSIPAILEDKPVFVNFTRNLLDSPPPIDKSRLVVEVLEDVVIDEPTIAAIRQLKELGYTIALDDYVYAEGHHELVLLADLIKIDVLINSMDKVRKLVAQLLPYGVTLLAEKVETQEIFEECKQLGFKLFQGYFLSRPQLVEGRALKSNERTVLQLISTLRSTEVEFSEIERVIQTDSILAFKILRLVNSALFNQQREIKSIRQALTFLGLEKIRGWAQLLALSNLDKKPPALFITTMVRARLGQLLAERSHSMRSLSESQFTIGLLSTLDAFLGMKLEQILGSIAVPDSMRAAILEHQGDSGFLLEISVAYERAEWESIDWPRLEALGIDAASAQQAYMSSAQWASENLQFLR